MSLLVPFQSKRNKKKIHVLLPGRTDITKKIVSLNCYLNKEMLHVQAKNIYIYAL